MELLTPIRNHIIFQFEERSVVQDGIAQFVEQTDAGIELVRSQDSAGAGRWGYITQVGPDAIEDGFEVGMRVFITPLMWTTALAWKEEDIWRTDSNQILCIDEAFDGKRKVLNDHSAVTYQH